MKLTVLTSHPIQYQAPLWRALAEELELEVWFLTDQGQGNQVDKGFGTAFTWDVDLLSGYASRYLEVMQPWRMDRFAGVRLEEDIRERLRETRPDAVWIEGWRFAAHWQVMRACFALDIPVWMRGETNDLYPRRGWKARARTWILRHHFRRVGCFLCIGSANRRFYRSMGVPEAKMVSAPYHVDSAHFAATAATARERRADLRRQWNIRGDAFCLLFMGKLEKKKRPLDLVAAAGRARRCLGRPVHLLFAGTGALGKELRAATRVEFDVEEGRGGSGPAASFAGFLNQSRVVEAYVAADALVLPSDARETWGLVVNEALACGLPCIVSDRAGCAEDLIRPVDPERVFPCGDVEALADVLRNWQDHEERRAQREAILERHSIRTTVEAVVRTLRKEGMK